MEGEKYEEYTYETFSWRKKRHTQLGVYDISACVYVYAHEHLDGIILVFVILSFNHFFQLSYPCLLPPGK